MSCAAITPEGTRIAPSARQILLSVNPKAGARSGRPRVEQLRARLQEKGYGVRECRGLDDLRESSAELLRQGTLRAVVAAGGDGTVRLVANETPAGVPIAILPLGTENLLSKYLALPPDPREISTIIDQGWTVRLDAGLANDRLFLLMAGIGFDADVVRRLHATRTGHIRHWSYVKPIVESIRSYEYPPVRVYCDPDNSAENSRSIEARWVFAVNLPRYAGGLCFVPSAVGTDGLLDICTFRQGFLANGLRYLLGVSLGMHVAWRDCEIVQAARVRIVSEGRVPYQLDGDPAGHLPLDVSVLPQRLTLLVGKNWARGKELERRPVVPSGCL